MIDEMLFIGATIVIVIVIVIVITRCKIRVIGVSSTSGEKVA